MLFLPLLAKRWQHKPRYQAAPAFHESCYGQPPPAAPPPSSAAPSITDLPGTFCKVQSALLTCMEQEP